MITSGVAYYCQPLDPRGDYTTYSFHAQPFACWKNCGVWGRNRDSKGARSKAQQRRAERKDSCRIAKMANEHLQSFLRFTVSADESAAQILSMDACDYLLRRVENTEFATFQDGETTVNKVKVLLDMFGPLQNNGVLRPLILSWMNEAIDKSLYSVRDDDSLTYSSISSKPSSDAESHDSSISSKPTSDAHSQASQIATVHFDMAKAKEVGQVVALLEVDEVEKQLNVMNFPWEGTRETAQVLINEIIRKIEALELGPEDLRLRAKAIESFQKETNFETRVHFLRFAFCDNTIGAVQDDSIADESGSTHASSAEQTHGTHP